MSSWTATQHQQLLNLIISELGDQAVVGSDGMTISVPGGGLLGLTNLIKSLKGVPEGEWARTLEAYLPLFTAHPHVPTDFAVARRDLRIRLDPDASQPGWAAHRPVCDGLDQMLVYKTDCGALTVSEQVIEDWGVPADEVWAEALEHTIWDEPRDRRILEKRQVRIVWVRHSFFASSVLLSLDHLLSSGNRFGAVVMAPIRDALLYAEVNDEQVVHAAAAMIEVGGRWYVDEPGAISADLFWYRPTSNGPRISRIVREVNRRYEPCWGSDFSAALAELSADLDLIDRDRKRHRTLKRSTPTMPM